MRLARSAGILLGLTAFMVATPAWAEGSVTVGSLTYECTATGALVTDYKPTPNRSATVADTVDCGGVDTPVVGIAKGAFVSSVISSMTLGANVTSISKDAFFSSMLSTVDMRAVTVIDDRAFAFTELTGITLDDDLVSIGDHAFYATMIPSLTVPASVLSLGNGALTSDALTTITFEGAPPAVDGDPFDQDVWYRNHAGVTTGITVWVPSAYLDAYLDAGWESYAFVDSVQAFDESTPDVVVQPSAPEPEEEPRLLPIIRASRVTALPGDSLLVMGESFPASELVTITGPDDATLASVVADEEGHFSALVTLDDETETGTFRFVATTASGASAAGGLLVQAAISPSADPTPTPHPTQDPEPTFAPSTTNGDGVEGGSGTVVAGIVAAVAILVLGGAGAAWWWKVRPAGAEREVATRRD